MWIIFIGKKLKRMKKGWYQKSKTKKEGLNNESFFVCMRGKGEWFCRFTNPPAFKEAGKRG